MELPYDCPLHVCKAKGFMAEKGEPTKLLIPRKDRKKRVNCNCGPVISILKDTGNSILRLKFRQFVF